MKYIYFSIGYLAALVTILMTLMIYSPLQASGSQIGTNKYNPLYVHVTNCDQ